MKVEFSTVEEAYLLGVLSVLLLEGSLPHADFAVSVCEKLRSRLYVAGAWAPKRQVNSRVVQKRKSRRRGVSRVRRKS